MPSTPRMRIPFTGGFPPPLIIPPNAATPAGAVAALASFLSAPRQTPLLVHNDRPKKKKTVVLTGAGISVASGLADYRGTNGTYTHNKSYRPIYYGEFVSSHEARKRYWARSFLGWRPLKRSKPNATHYAIRDLGQLGLISSVITQNVDSFHGIAHPQLPTVELHGFLRTLVCLSCRRQMPRDDFQQELARLNPTWAAFLQELLQSGALETENPDEQRKMGYRTNPDGDADVPGASYTTFRYPACPHCLGQPPRLKDKSKGTVKVDADGAWCAPSDSGVLKPNVVMFGENISDAVKQAAEEAINEAERVLVVGSSLATYSAWRLIKQAFDQTMAVGILNLGGVRKEEHFFSSRPGAAASEDSAPFRASFAAEHILPEVVRVVTGEITDVSMINFPNLQVQAGRIE
ncbi:hypothetical protein DV735_g5100, partial [Chaetothyriales sp. CBS 134920]